MDSEQKKLVVIVPGSRTKEVRIPLIRMLMQSFYSHFGVDETGDEWVQALHEHLEDETTDVVIFTWSGGISPIATGRAAKRLRTFLEEQKDREIILFTKSLGGVVAEKALKDGGIHVLKLIQVATPHFRFRRKLENTEVINIYSPEDTYHTLAHKVLFLGMGTFDVPHAQNIALSGIMHSGFNYDNEIVYKGKTQSLFDLYKEIVDN
ncbi:hypothetical protein KTR10_01785 [Candidatus Kaiserbacteria bacterium]|nr:hypothetical protein [Candidatus Kaiserbacteria bacterium]